MTISGKPLYCNWAATSPVKLYSLGEVEHTLLARSGWAPDEETGAFRDCVCGFFRFAQPARVIMGAGATDLLNKLILGSVPPGGGRVLASVLEHNSVLRPLFHVRERHGTRIDFFEPEADGYFSPDRFGAALGKDTSFAVVTHASNVTGAIQPVKELVARAHDRGVPVIVDAAQTAGRIPVDMSDIGADALVCSAHKGFMGPSGFGFAMLAEGFEPEPVFSGGTGYRSELERQPGELPWRLEAGTPHYEGASRTGECMAAHAKRDVFGAWAAAGERAGEFIGRVRRIDGVRLAGVPGRERLPIVNIVHERFSPDELGYMLHGIFGVIGRAGLHCAPRAHRWLGTFPAGTLRLSFGCASTADEMERVIDALIAVSAGRAG